MIESENTSTPGNVAGNVAGVVGNVPVGNPSGGSVDQNPGMAKSKKENIRTEYAIPSEVEQIVVKGGQVVGLSVSVCLAKGEKIRAADELKKIEQLVRNAVGCVENEKRKDKVEVAEMEFPRQAQPVVASPWERMIPDADFMKTAGMWAVAVFLVWMIGRKLTGGSEVRHESVGVPLQTVAEAQLAAEFGGREVDEEAMTPAARNVKELQAVAEQNPMAIAAWIKSVSRESGA
jgi:flagellar biosynthesis/type III secretory pathway M-ring protein FliF/YscJ